MADWDTTASLATAGGTLVLALATFSSVRSANRAARLAERSLMAGLRPLLLASRAQDPPEKVLWGDEHAARVEGGRGVVEQVGGVVYLAFTLRNAGPGIGVIHGWYVWEGWHPEAGPAPLDGFRRQQRDLYIPSGDTGFWQGAIRDADDPDRPRLAPALARQRFMIDLLYGDYEGGQRTITRINLSPFGDTGWIAGTARHWNVDRPDPR
ncbi:MAG TPA: hypothetical protein VF743_12410 [Acidimicrobiales bacterium]